MQATRLGRVGRRPVTNVRRFGTRWRLRLVSGLIAGSAIVGGVLWLSWPPSLERQAVDILEAALEGRTDVLYDHSFEHEKRLTGLTRDSIARLWPALVEPRFARFSYGPIQSYLEPKGHQAVAWTTLRDQNGGEFEVHSIPFATDDGGRTHVLNYLVMAWISEYVVSAGEEVTVEAAARAISQGIKHDRLILDELELMGIAYSEDEFFTWDEILTHNSSESVRRDAE
ncbi:MAG: hypothetical protein IH851_02275 [Armatimonadetes bacterium]|nr:hypothetical protein [Armatimonadota bacterium]